MNIAVITHVDRAAVGLVAATAQAHAHQTEIVRPYRGEPLPAPECYDAVVVLGGPQSVYESEAHPHLEDEQKFLAAAVGDQVPVLAICLGAQLLSRALGGSAHPGHDGLEAGLIEVRALADASREVSGRYFSFHSDSMTPPRDAEVLASSDRYVQAWTLGSALALQFHPEITARGVRDLLEIEGPKLARHGVDVAALRVEAEQYFQAGAPDARALLESWFATGP